MLPQQQQKRVFLCARNRNLCKIDTFLPKNKPPNRYFTLIERRGEILYILAVIYTGLCRDFSNTHIYIWARNCYSKGNSQFRRHTASRLADDLPYLSFFMEIRAASFSSAFNTRVWNFYGNSHGNLQRDLFSGLSRVVPYRNFPRARLESAIFAKLPFHRVRDTRFLPPSRRFDLFDGEKILYRSCTTCSPLS